MVPDVNQVVIFSSFLQNSNLNKIIDSILIFLFLQIIVKEKGIFTNVTSPTAKAKLRLLFEVAPLGFLIEKAGGYSSDGTQSVLDKVIVNLDDRTQVAYGSKNEIIRFEETLYGSSRLKAGGVPVGALCIPSFLGATESGIRAFPWFEFETQAVLSYLSLCPAPLIPFDIIVNLFFNTKISKNKNSDRSYSDGTE